MVTQPPILHPHPLTTYLYTYLSTSTPICPHSHSSIQPFDHSHTHLLIHCVTHSPILTIPLLIHYLSIQPPIHLPIHTTNYQSTLGYPPIRLPIYLISQSNIHPNTQLTTFTLIHSSPHRAPSHHSWAQAPCDSSGRFNEAITMGLQGSCWDIPMTHSRAEACRNGR